jgi:hypothetical protein
VGGGGVSGEELLEALEGLVLEGGVEHGVEEGGG